MALGTITVTSSEHKAASSPLGFAVLSFVGDSATPSGGTAGFQASVRTAMSRSVSLIAVIPLGLNGGYDLVYNKADDKLAVKAGAVEATGNLSGTTFKVGVLYV